MRQTQWYHFCVKFMHLQQVKVKLDEVADTLHIKDTLINDKGHFDK